jgi:hypothetical protein
MRTLDCGDICKLSRCFRDIVRAAANLFVSVSPRASIASSQRGPLEWFPVFKMSRWCSCRWGESVSLNCSHQRAYCSSSKWCMDMESHGGMILTGEKRRTLRNTLASATLSTTNPTWTDWGAKQGLHGEEACDVTSWTMTRPVVDVCILGCNAM